MKAKEFIPTTKPRNFVAKNQKTAGAGQHKDKKRAEKQGDVKHKNKQFEEGAIIAKDDLVDIYIKGTGKNNMPIQKKVGAQIPNSKVNSFISKVAEKYGLNPKAFVYGPSKGVIEVVKNSEDWDEGNTEPGNNFAVYINGKKWKVLPGPQGAYADSPEEKRELGRLQGMAQRKSQETGKKWEVYVTGEPATK